MYQIGLNFKGFGPTRGGLAPPLSHLGPVVTPRPRRHNMTATRGKKATMATVKLLPARSDAPRSEVSKRGPWAMRHMGAT